jgi:hypothetical protein
MTLIVVHLVACMTPAPAPPAIDSPVAVPTSPLENTVSPLATPVGGLPVGRFTLNKPIVEGTTQVSGTGPAGVPIIIADVTFLGDPLGFGTVNADGTFSISVAALERNHLIGLTLGDLSGTPWKPEHFYAPEYYGDDLMQAPQAGFYHDTAMVQSP